MTLTHHSRVRLKVGECVCSRKWSARECEHFNGEKSTCAKKKNLSEWENPHFLDGVCFSFSIHHASDVRGLANCLKTRCRRDLMSWSSPTLFALQVVFSFLCFSRFHSGKVFEVRTKYPQCFARKSLKNALKRPDCARLWFIARAYTS